MDVTAAAVPWRPALWKFLWVGLTSFGAGRWPYLHEAFVRNGWIEEDVFLRDFAMSQVLPGAGFVNLSALCGLRLGGVPMALAGVTLVTLPGAVLIAAAMLLLTGTDPRITGGLHGVVIGAVGLLLASFVRLARSIRRRFDVALALAALALTLAGVPLAFTVLVVGAVAVAVLRYAVPEPAEE